MHGISNALKALEARRRRDRRALAVGVTLSLILHLGGFALHVSVPAAAALHAGPTSVDAFGTRLVVLAPSTLARPVLPDPTPPSPTAAPRHVGPFVEILPVPPDPRPRTSAATLLRSGAPDPRLAPTALPAAPSSALARTLFATAFEAAPARPSSVVSRDAQLVSSWGDPAAGAALQPGRVVLDGRTLPLCGGTGAARCGFGALPWDLERADRWTEYLVGLDDQLRRADRQERARAIRERLTGRDTLDGR